MSNTPKEILSSHENFVLVYLSKDDQDTVCAKGHEQQSMLRHVRLYFLNFPQPKRICDLSTLVSINSNFKRERWAGKLNPKGHTRSELATLTVWGQMGVGGQEPAQPKARAPLHLGAELRVKVAEETQAGPALGARRQRDCRGVPGLVSFLSVGRSWWTSRFACMKCSFLTSRLDHTYSQNREGDFMGRALPIRTYKIGTSFRAESTSHPPRSPLHRREAPGLLTQWALPP